jgi:hypothetical protein
VAAHGQRVFRAAQLSPQLLKASARPAGALEVYYSAEVSFFPWHPSPHRRDVLVTNKHGAGEAQ